MSSRYAQSSVRSTKTEISALLRVLKITFFLTSTAAYFDMITKHPVFRGFKVPVETIHSEFYRLSRVTGTLLIRRHSAVEECVFSECPCKIVAYSITCHCNILFDSCWGDTFLKLFNFLTKCFAPKQPYLKRLMLTNSKSSPNKPYLLCYFILCVSQKSV